MNHKDAVEYLAAQENDRVAIPDEFYNREETLPLVKAFVDTLTLIPNTTQLLYDMWIAWLCEQALADES